MEQIPVISKITKNYKNLCHIHNIIIKNAAPIDIDAILYENRVAILFASHSHHLPTTHYIVLHTTQILRIQQKKNAFPIRRHKAQHSVWFFLPSHSFQMLLKILNWASSQIYILDTEKKINFLYKWKSLQFVRNNYNDMIFM